MTVDSVNFNQNTRFTKKGNPYQQTNIAKKAGLGAGLATVATTYIVNHKYINNEFYSEISKKVKNGAQIENLVKLAKIKGVGKMALAFAGVGIAVGAIVDGIVNKVKANKADKENA